MTEFKDFLTRFSDNLKHRVLSASFYDALDSFTYDSKFDYENAQKKLSYISDVENKILSIIYNPHIKVDTEEVIKRSELSGNLSRESFDRTMRDPKIWKNKNGQMVPEYVHTVDTIDSIDTYENQFIANLIDKIDLEIDKILCALNPLLESIEEHYQSKEINFSEFSLFTDLRRQSYPYNSFFIRRDVNKDEVLTIAKKLKRKVKNFKSTTFYKICSKHKITRVLATNIMIHDNLYSFCYRFYLNNYEMFNDEEKLHNAYLYNYFTVSLLKVMKDRKIFTDENQLHYQFGEDGRMQIPASSFFHYPFRFQLNYDCENEGLQLTILLYDEQGREVDHAVYEFLFVENLTEENYERLTLLKDMLAEKGVDQILIVTANNIIREYHGVITFAYYKDNHRMTLENLLSSMSMLFEVEEELYYNFCPVCGHNHIVHKEDCFVCTDCSAVYHICKFEGKSLLWVKSFRREI